MTPVRHGTILLGATLLAIIHASSGFTLLQRQQPFAKNRALVAAKKTISLTTARNAVSQPNYKRRSLVEFIPSGSLTPTLGVLLEPRKLTWQVTTADGATAVVPLEAFTYIDSSISGWLPLDSSGPNLASTLASCTAAATSAVADISLVANSWKAIREAEPSADSPRLSFVEIAGLFHCSNATIGVEKSAQKVEGTRKPSTAARYATHAILQSPAGKAHFAPCTSASKQSDKQLWVCARSPAEVATALAALDTAKVARSQWQSVALALAERVQARREEQLQPQFSHHSYESADGFSESPVLVGPDLIRMAIRDLEALAVEFDPSGNSMPKPLQALSPSTPASTAADDEKSLLEKSTTIDLPGGFAACFLGLGALSAWSRDARGAFGLLVALGHWSPHHDLSLPRSTLPHALPWRPETLKAQAKLMIRPPPDPFSTSSHDLVEDNPSSFVDGQAVVGKRKDLTHMTCYAIDSEDTYEVDDAVSAERLDEHGQPLPDGEGSAAIENGANIRRVRHWVHVVDVSRWLPNPHSELAQETRRRQTSLYLPYGKQPMIPAALVARDMALAPPHANYPPPYEGTPEYMSSQSLGGGGVGPSPEDAMKSLSTSSVATASATSETTRPTLSVGFELDPNTGALMADSVVLCAATIRIAMRLSYDECDDMLHLGLGGFHEPDWALGCLEQAAIARQEWRKSQCPAFFHQLPFMDVKAWPEQNKKQSSSGKLQMPSPCSGGTPFEKEIEVAALSDSNNLPGDFTWRASAQPAGVSQCRSSLLVSELMVASGEAVGMLGRKHRLALPYRSQVAANKGSGPPSPSDIEEELADLDAVSGGDWRCRSYRLRKYMGKGNTTPKPGKHYGLGLDQ